MDASLTKSNRTLGVLHDDKDLVQLAGYHAYLKYREGYEINVNGKVFRVEDYEYDTPTGLDVFTVRNVTVLDEDGELSDKRNNNGELIVVFVGSQQPKTDWIETNINLLGDKEPAQLEAAKAYVEEVEKDIGKVSSVTGNSLGGALANRVAIDHPSIKSVTFNTAILPGGMVDQTKNYSNITNYQSEDYDILTHMQTAINYNHRIPGKSYNINNGLPIVSQILVDHTGYVDADDDGNFTVEIGKKGEPGHGFIHVGADDHIVLSAWTGAPLHGGSSVPIRINPADLSMLADALKNNVTGRLILAGEYIDHATSIVEDEKAKFNKRVSKLQEILHDELDKLSPVVKGMATSGNEITRLIDELLRILDLAEERCRSLNRVLNSGPAEVIEFIFSLDISVESLFKPVRDFLEKVKDNTNRLTDVTGDIIEEYLPSIFKGGIDMFADAVVGELDAHYNIIHKNKGTVLGLVEGYEQQVRGVADVFEKLDHNLGIAIDTNTLPPEDIEVLQPTPSFCILPSLYLDKKLKIKEHQVEWAHTSLKRKVGTTFTPILLVIESILLSIEKGLRAILFSITTSVNLVAYSPTGLVVNYFSDYIQNARDAAEEVKRPIREMKDLVENIKIGVKEAKENLPEMMDFFKDYIDIAIFTPSKYRNVQLYNIASTAILGEMEILFSDIVFQLSNQQAKAIEGVVSNSRLVLINLEALREQVAKGSI